MNKTQSYFKFEITQTTQVLLNKIQAGKGKRWTIKKGKDDQTILLEEIGKPENVATVRVVPNVLHITTVRGFVYIVEDKKSNGANVSFSGPVNALLAQSLMPHMTYVPQTLWGKTSDMFEYVPIQKFMELREKRHNGRVNPQDQRGWRINMKFNNELTPWLPAFQSDFGNKNKR